MLGLALAEYPVAHWIFYRISGRILSRMTGSLQKVSFSIRPIQYPAKHLISGSFLLLPINNSGSLEVAVKCATCRTQRPDIRPPTWYSVYPQRCVSYKQYWRAWRWRLNVLLSGKLERQNCGSGWGDWPDPVDQKWPDPVSEIVRIRIRPSRKSADLQKSGPSKFFPLLCN